MCQVMAQRGGPYPGLDIPEFYEIGELLFAPEEAEINNIIPRRLSTLAQITLETELDPKKDAKILARITDKGLFLQ